jgi:hypothetical protein
MRRACLLLSTAFLACASAPVHADTVLYTQDFEAPVGFVNDGGDINIYRTVNQLYGNQPTGFTFAQSYTTETLLVGGSKAFLTGYKDPSGIAGHYVVSMLSDRQNDLLSLSFDAGNYGYLNFALDVSSIDLDRFGGPFVPTGGLAPVYRITLYDNPTGATTLAGNGTVLDTVDVMGTVSPNKYTFDWTHAIVGLETAGTTNGHVTLQIDLLSGGYAAMDNFKVVASDVKGVVPEPASAALVIGGGLLVWARRRATSRAARQG